jgi:hypothetical protein
VEEHLDAVDDLRQRRQLQQLHDGALDLEGGVGAGLVPGRQAVALDNRAAAI